MKTLSVCGIVGIVLFGLSIFAILNATAGLEAVSGMLETGEPVDFSDSIYEGLGMGLIGASFGLAQSIIVVVIAADRRKKRSGNA